MFEDQKKHQRKECSGYEQSLPYSWTEESALWLLKQLRLLVFQTRLIKNVSFMSPQPHKSTKNTAEN